MLVEKFAEAREPSNEWKKAGEAICFPRAGYFYPKRKPKWDASVNPRYLGRIGLEDYNFVESEKFFESMLKLRWQLILMNRQVQEVENSIPGNGYDNMLTPVAFAPTTEQLFKEVIAPTVQKHCKKYNKSALAVGNVRYLIPLWSRKELGPVKIVEGDLHKLIKNGGRLPDNVGAVYIDYPSNQTKKDSLFSHEELLKFIKKHPLVLFIFDQANLYYKTPGLNNVRDLMLKWHGNDFFGKTSIHDFDYSSVIVTNTTSKSAGLSGCAIAVATSGAEDFIKSSRDPAVLVGFDKTSAKKRALAALNLELPQIETAGFPSTTEDVPAFQFRKIIQKNRETLASRLEELFPGVTCQDTLVVEGARVIIDANKVGFPSAQSLCEFLYKYCDIGTKPAWVYASQEVRKEWDKYLQITVPWNDKMLKAFLVTFEYLKAEFNP